MSSCHRERFGKLMFRALNIDSDEGLTLETSAFIIFHGDNSPFIISTCLIKPNLLVTNALYTHTSLNSLNSRFKPILK